MTGPDVAQLPRFGLYYPYVHFREERWLKMAALYWPRLARIVAPGFTVHDSEMVRRLAEELDFTIDLNPGPAISSVAPAFRTALDGLIARQRAEYRVERLLREFRDSWRQQQPWWQQQPRLPEAGEAPQAFDENPPLRFGAVGRLLASMPPPPKLAGVYATEVDPELSAALLDTGLASPTGDGQWLMMHRDLAWAYKCVLSAEIAAQNTLTLATDQIQAQAVVGLPVSTVVDHGLGNWRPPQDAQRAGPDYTSIFALMSLKLIVPQNLDATPIEKIITVRRRFGEEFEHWRRQVDLVGRQLSEQLAGVESPELVDAYLRDSVRQQAERPLAGLRRGLRDVGIDAGQAAVTPGFRRIKGVLGCLGRRSAGQELDASAKTQNSIVTRFNQLHRVKQVIDECQLGGLAGFALGGTPR